MSFYLEKLKKVFQTFFSVKNEYIDMKKNKVITLLSFKFIFEIRSCFLFKEYQPRLIEGLRIIQSPKKSKKNLTAICAIFKNEPDIKEWIEYHKLIGFDKFYLYNNESTNNPLEILKPYIEEESVIYHYIPGKCMQNVYRDAVARYKKNTQWLAIIDLDEYICPVEKNNIKDFLKDYKHEVAVGINWVLFNSNGHQKRPDKLVIDAYTRVMKDYQAHENLHIKSIVKPKEVRCITNPHFCFYYDKFAKDENFNTIGNERILFNSSNVDNAFTERNSVNKIRINHYHTKSFEDYCEKRKLGYPDQIKERPEIDEFLNFSVETTNDYVIQKYLPMLKEKMGVC